LVYQSLTGLSIGVNYRMINLDNPKHPWEDNYAPQNLRSGNTGSKR
jgi:hypothetical protein